MKKNSKKEVVSIEESVTDMEKMLNDLKKLADEHGGMFVEQVTKIEKQLADKKEELFENLSPWQTIKIARNPDRPVFRDYIEHIFTDFTELHGDRRFSDDTALSGGFARIGGQPVMVVGHNKGKNIEENVDRNFGSAKPDGYRKAMRLMQLAERFNVPVISLIDTQGAFPGLEAEERGQAEAIARNLVDMAKLTVPIVVIVTGEGGSGGALGIGVGDRVMMLANSAYSVISPEGCASILWRDGTKAPIAAEALKLTAPYLIEFGVVDRVIDEPIGGAHTNYELTMKSVKAAILEELKSLKKLSPKKLTEKRFEKFSNMGIFNK
jgi:acetyl-CoA carboxylase carboxyl transferase subunit alpha